MSRLNRLPGPEWCQSGKCRDEVSTALHSITPTCVNTDSNEGFPKVRKSESARSCIWRAWLRDHRSAIAHYDHRPPQMGAWVMINALCLQFASSRSYGLKTHFISSRPSSLCAMRLPYSPLLSKMNQSERRCIPNGS